MKKIKVPEGMLDAFLDAMLEGTGREYKRDLYRESWRKELEASLIWLSENPIVPTFYQALDIHESVQKSCKHVGTHVSCYAVEWQRRMFLSPDEDEPIADLLNKKPEDEYAVYSPKFFNEKIREAYKRGKEGK